MSGCKSDEEHEFYIHLCIKENYSKRQLERQLDSGYYERYMPRYWSQNNLPYEVDFLIQRENTTSKSMKKFKELFPDKVRLRIRFSLDNLNLDDGVLNIPLFMADQADRLIGLALEKRKQ